MHECYCQSHNMLIQFQSQPDSKPESLQRLSLYFLAPKEGAPSRLRKYSAEVSLLRSSQRMSHFDECRDVVDFLQNGRNFIWNDLSRCLTLHWCVTGQGYKKLQYFNIDFNEEILDQKQMVEAENKVLWKELELVRKKLMAKNEPKPKNHIQGAGYGEMEAEQENQSEPKSQKYEENEIKLDDPGMKIHEDRDQQFLKTSIAKKKSTKDIKQERQDYLAALKTKKIDKPAKQKQIIVRNLQLDRLKQQKHQKKGELHPKQKQHKRQTQDSALKAAQLALKREATHEVERKIMIKSVPDKIIDKIKKDKHKGGKEPQVKQKPSQPQKQIDRKKQNLLQRNSIKLIQNAKSRLDTLQEQSSNSSPELKPLTPMDPPSRTKNIALQEQRRYLGSNRYEIIYDNGQSYVGEMQQNRYHGKGTLYTRGYTFQGNWLNGETHGPGKAVYEDGTTEEGIYREGFKRTGKGLDVYTNGDRYEGEFVDERKNGFGIYYFSDGERYEGQFLDDMAHGSGTECLKDGSRFEGTWDRDQKHGEGYLHTKGTKIRQVWHHGKLGQQELSLISSDQQQS